jgi:hypothetical protein
MDTAGSVGELPRGYPFAGAIPFTDAQHED